MNFDRIKDMLYQEIDEIGNQNGLTIDCVEALGEMVDILKDIAEIEAMENYNYQDNGYSNGGYSQRGGRTYRYYDGNSYNGGNGSYGSRMMRRNGYSREDGKQYMISELERMMNEVQNENDKMEIHKLVEKMKNN